MAVEFDRKQTPTTPAPQKRGAFINRVEFNRKQSQLPATTTYVMRGEDAAVAGRYDTWKSPLSPDFSASLYAGSLATPIRDVVVQAKVTG